MGCRVAWGGPAAGAVPATPLNPRIGDDAKLREVLLAAKRAKPVERLAQVPALIEALDTALKDRTTCDRLKTALLGTLKQVPIMPQDPTMGSEPVKHRWVVFKPAVFDRLVQEVLGK